MSGDPSSPAAPDGRAAPRFPVRVGLAIVAPGQALGLIEAKGQGGFGDAVWLVLVAALAFRFDELAAAFVALSSASLGSVLRQILGTVSRELLGAAFVVIPVSLAITIFAGRGRRDPSRDLELGAAAYAPFFAVRTVFEALAASVLDGALPRSFATAATVLGGLGAANVALRAIALARRRAEGASPAAGAASLTRAGVLAGVLTLLVGVTLAFNVSWVARESGKLGPLRRGAPAPSFALPLVNPTPEADTLSLGALRGRFVLLDFWATWCPPCVQMIPTMHELHATWAPRGLAIVGINSDGGAADLDEIRAFLRTHPSPYPMVLDDGRAAKLYRVTSLPHLVLLAPDGAVVKTFWGYTLKAELESALRAAMDQP